MLTTDDGALDVPPVSVAVTEKYHVPEVRFWTV
jgi:hypothetical protein